MNHIGVIFRLHIQKLCESWPSGEFHCFVVGHLDLCSSDDEWGIARQRYRESFSYMIKNNCLEVFGMASQHVIIKSSVLIANVDWCWVDASRNYLFNYRDLFLVSIYIHVYLYEKWMFWQTVTWAKFSGQSEHLQESLFVQISMSVNIFYMNDSRKHFRKIF